MSCFCCDAVNRKCNCCDNYVCIECSIRECKNECEMCDECETECEYCRNKYCIDCLSEEELCEGVCRRNICEGCMKRCNECDKRLCKNEIIYYKSCNKYNCKKCHIIKEKLIFLSKDILSIIMRYAVTNRRREREKIYRLRVRN